MLLDNIPNFGLYSDQVIEFVEDLLGKRRKLTSSMINNYVKMQLMPRPTKKKYYNEHIRRLIIITLLKSVYSLDEIKIIFKNGLNEDNLFRIFESLEFDDSLESHIVKSLISKDEVLDRMVLDDSDKKS